MLTIRKYVPNWVEMDLDKLPAVVFGNTKELLDIPWVRSWTTYGGFMKFFKKGDMLFAKFADGRWWGVGKLSDASQVNIAEGP